ncbi:MAG: cytochrome c [Gemmatimonadetes bacterium]|nr:cytochrome c [Gemmatimonadota bacterium]
MSRLALRARARARRVGGLAAVVVAGLAAAACGHEFEPPDRQARVDSLAARFSLAMFDSIAWESENLRETAGNLVFAERCVRCHGPLGRGDTDYARARGVAVPSLVQADWPLAAIDSLRRTIYVGHEEGMPIYGDGAVTLRDIDAVSAYVLEVLRPDVLGAP